MRIIVGFYLLMFVAIGCSSNTEELPEPLPLSWNEVNLERHESPIIKEKKEYVGSLIGNTLNRITYFSEDGLMNKTELVAGPTSLPFNTTVYEYDEFGNEVSSTQTAIGSDLYLYFGFEYDEENRVIKTLVADKEGMENLPFQTMSYTNGENLEIRTMLSFNEYGEEVEKLIEESQFDSLGRVIRITSSIQKSGQEIADVNHVLFFYGDKEVKPESSANYVTEEMNNVFFKTFDSAGNKIEEWNYLGGVVRSLKRYVYNEYGELLEKHIPSDNFTKAFILHKYELNEFGYPSSKTFVNYARNEVDKPTTYEYTYY